MKVELSFSNSELNAEVVDQLIQNEDHVDIWLYTGIINHDQLYNRDKPDQHPIKAITGLEDELSGIHTDISSTNIKLDAEIERSVAEDIRLDNKIDAETNRATNVETQIRADLTIETNRSIAEDARLNGLIVDESARAKAAEEVLDNKIDAESDRAQEAEQILNTAINTESDRAKAEEAAIKKSVADEIVRATTAENKIAGDLATESARAKDAETNISNTLASEVTRAQEAEAILRADITENAKKIDELDTAYKEGDAATKALIDAETLRAKTAEQVLNDTIVTETERATDAETTITNALDAETTRAKAAEATNAANIITESNRAKAEESKLQTAIDTKVDKVDGKSLVSDTEITKLSQLKTQDEITNDINTAADNTLKSAKAYTDNAVSTVYKPMGSLVSVDDLASLTNVRSGDVYNIETAGTLNGKPIRAGDNVVAIVAEDGTVTWDILAGIVDTTQFVDTITVDPNSTGNAFTGYDKNGNNLVFKKDITFATKDDLSSLNLSITWDKSGEGTLYAITGINDKTITTKSFAIGGSNAPLSFKNISGDTVSYTGENAIDLTSGIDLANKSNYIYSTSGDTYVQYNASYVAGQAIKVLGTNSNSAAINLYDPSNFAVQSAKSTFWDYNTNKPLSFGDSTPGAGVPVTLMGSLSAAGSGGGINKFPTDNITVGAAKKDHLGNIIASRYVAKPGGISNTITGDLWIAPAAQATTLLRLGLSDYKYAVHHHMNASTKKYTVSYYYGMDGVKQADMDQYDFGTKSWTHYADNDIYKGKIQLQSNSSYGAIQIYGTNNESSIGYGSTDTIDWTVGRGAGSSGSNFGWYYSPVGLICYVQTDGHFVCRYDVTGKVFHGTNFVTSDKRCKSNIAKVTDMDCERALLSSIYTFNLKDDRDTILSRSSGCIAQEVQSIGLDYLVHENNNKLELDYTGLHSLQIEALRRQIEQLKDSINMLQIQLDNARKSMSISNTLFKKGNNILTCLIKAIKRFIWKR